MEDMDKKQYGLSLSAILNLFVVGIVLAALLGGLWVFVSVFRHSVEQSALTSSEQAVVQASNAVRNYTVDMEGVMGTIEEF